VKDRPAVSETESQFDDEPQPLTRGDVVQQSPVQVGLLLLLVLLALLVLWIVWSLIATA